MSEYCKHKGCEYPFWSYKCKENWMVEQPFEGAPTSHGDRLEEIKRELAEEAVLTLKDGRWVVAEIEQLREELAAVREDNRRHKDAVLALTKRIEERRL